MLIADVEADEETQVVEESSANLDSEGNPEDVAGALDEEGDGGEHTKKKKEREEGKSLLPFTRVQKIMKADRDLPIVMKEATFLISLATEEFIKRFMQAIYAVADKEKRAILQERDVAVVVNKVDEFTFLEELLGWHAVTRRKRKPRALQKRDKDADPTMMDLFVKSSRSGNKAAKGDQEEEGQGDVIMNDDGTMGVSNNGEVL